VVQHAQRRPPTCERHAERVEREPALEGGAHRPPDHAARELDALAAEALAYHGVPMVLGAQRETAPVRTEPFPNPGEAVACALEAAQALTAQTGFVPGLTDRTLVREALTNALGGALHPSVGTASSPGDRTDDLLH